MRILLLNTVCKRTAWKYLLLILFFASPSLKAQTIYQPVFGNYNTNWNIYGANLDISWTDSFYTAGDTIINSLQYKIVKPTLGFEPVVYLRSDSTNGKLWSLTYPEFNLPEEHLLMDLSLNLGDSLYVNGPNGVSGNFPVDSVYSFENRRYVRINLYYCGAIGNGQREKLTFIEGVGPNAGLFYQDTLDDINIAPYLLCKHDNDTLVYSNTLFNHQCNIGGDGIASIESNTGIKLFPNPANGNVTLIINAAQASAEGRLSFYNLLGEVVSSQNITLQNGRNIITTDVSSLPAGFYFVEMYDGMNMRVEKLSVMR